MAAELADLVVRVAGDDDIGAVARVRAQWDAGAPEELDFERRLAAWVADEGDRRTIWLASLGDAPVGMASVLEYRRMPRPGRMDSRWGYLANMFVREDVRNRGIGAALLAAIVADADARGYVRLVLAPSERALSLYERAGFVVPDDAAGDHRLLVRPGQSPPLREDGTFGA